MKRLTVLALSTAAGLLMVQVVCAADFSSNAAKPLDLTGKYLFPISTLTNTNYFAWQAWRSVPTGHQVFHHVPFEINGQIRLWSTGREGYSTRFPKEISNIAVNRKFETLYVYHAAGFKSPDGTPVWELVYHYEDGSSATNALCFGADVLDWMVGYHEEPLATPYGTNSILAWVGGQYSEKQKNRLRFCMTALNNPHPDKLVTTIALVSCKNKTSASILAMTTGPAGMMEDRAAGKR